MRILYLIFVVGGIFVANVEFCQAKEVSLASRDFQKGFLQEFSDAMKTAAVDYLDKFLKGVRKPRGMEHNFEMELKAAMESTRLEPKIVFVKQYLDLAEHKDTNRENMYALRNVNFLKRLKDKIHGMQEESFDEIHQLRYFYLCKQFKVKMGGPRRVRTKSQPLVPIDEDSVGSMLHKLGAKDNHTVVINVQQFGNELYKRTSEAGADVINDYLIIVRKLLQEVLEPQSDEVSTAHSEALRKLLIEIDHLLNTPDFYTKRQRLYDYLQNDLALDYEQFQNSESSQHDLSEIFSKLKEKGLDLLVAFLFSNFEFIDYLQDQWQLLLPQAPISLYDERCKQLKIIQQLYAEFKQDFENSSKYDAYLEAVKQLHEQTLRDNADNTHIYEMLYSASQNVGSSRATLMNSKCNEI